MDVIGGGSDPQRGRRSWRLSALGGSGLSGVLRRRRRLLVTVGMLAVPAVVVGVSRVGLSDQRPAGGGEASPGRSATAELLQLAAGQENVYALVKDCPSPRTACGMRLMASRTDGRTWRELPLPGVRATVAAARGWRLSVTDPEDELMIEDAAAGVVHLSREVGKVFVTRSIVAGPDLHRVPPNGETLVRLCGKPLCTRPAVEFLEPRTGLRCRLATQPPFSPVVLAAEGRQLWVAGIQPSTRRFAVAVSSDGGHGWNTVLLPRDTDVALTLQLVPVPEQHMAYLLLGRSTTGAMDLWDVWTVPDPRTGNAPERVRPDASLTVRGAVGTPDGRLALVGETPTVLSQDGEVDRIENAAAPAAPAWRILRGPHGLLVAGVDRPDGVNIAVSPTGYLDDWDVRPIR